MKNLFVFALLACAVSFGFHTDEGPEEVTVKLGKAFIAKGFDSNDQSQITIVGEFIDTCYQVGKTEVAIDEDAKTVKLTQHALKYPGICLDVRVPYSKTVDLGVLGTDSYKVVDAVSEQHLGTLGVSRATSPGVGTDDHPYAPVEDIFIVQGASANTLDLLLHGTFTNSCLKFEKKEVRYQKEVIVVLPIVKLEERSDCFEGKFKFEERIPLKVLEDHPYLFHVRVMSGQAINKVFTGLKR